MISISRTSYLQIADTVPEPGYPRHVRPRLEEALAESPATLVHGPRQCGKTTLVRQVGEADGYAYVTFDNDVLTASAREDPVGFVDGLPERVILDEVQRVPSLFTSLKAAVDRDRRPGRFLLTGSANVLLLPGLADSLSGRLEILRLHPLSQAELRGTPSGFLNALFGGNFPAGETERLGPELFGGIVAGGYPPALARATPRRQATWYRDYVETLVQRDVQDLARIRSLDVLPRLLGFAAGQTARLINVSDLAAPFQLTRPTIREYLTLLESVFLLEELPPWHTNRLSRLVKTPKLHLTDTGVACALLNLDADGLAADRGMLGQLLETFVFQEIRRQASGHEDSFVFNHFRDRDGVEVDLVIERGNRQVAGVEVKAAATVHPSDFSGLRKLRQACGQHFAGGVVLYDGGVAAPFGDGLFAVPLRRLWES